MVPPQSRGHHLARGGFAAMLPVRRRCRRCEEPRGSATPRVGNPVCQEPRGSETPRVGNRVCQEPRTEVAITVTACSTA